MQINKYITPIESQKKIQEIMSATGKILEKPWHFNLQFLKLKNWAVVPVESAYHFTLDDINSLSKTFSKFHMKKGLAVPTETFKEIPFAYEVFLNTEGLQELNKACGIFNLILTNDYLDFATLCTAEDYFLLAGSVEFVTSALGKSISEARKEFMEFSDDEGWGAKKRDYLLFSVAKRYESFNG